MKSKITGTSLGLALLLSAIAESTAVDCSLTAVNNRLQNCAKLELSALLNPQNVQTTISDACKSAECSIGCYTRVFEGCSSTGTFQVIDLKAYKVAIRYVCQNSQDTLDGLQNCGMTTWTCFTNLINKIGHAVTQYSSSNITAYVSEYCSAASEFKTCKSSNPLSASGSCTSAQASVITNIYDVYLSIERCGISQTNPLFTTYDTAIDESTFGADKMRGPLIMTFVIVSAALKWLL